MISDRELSAIVADVRALQVQPEYLNRWLAFARESREEYEARPQEHLTDDGRELAEVIAGTLGLEYERCADAVLDYAVTPPEVELLAELRRLADMARKPARRRA